MQFNIFAQKISDSTWTENFRIREKKDGYVKINGDFALTDFNLWLEKRRDNLIQFDHAFGVTAYLEEKKEVYIF